MKKFYLELKVFRTKDKAHQELQAFVQSKHQEVMDASWLKRLKTDLIRKSWEISKKYPETKDLDVKFSTYNPLGRFNQFVQVNTNFRLAIMELGEIETDKSVTPALS